MKTKERIVQAGLELFNEFGVQAITTNHIAAHLGISPGNLYYHFRNKEDIISSIFADYMDKMGQLLVVERGLGELEREDILEGAERIVETLWNYRFFYASITELLKKDEGLKASYQKMQREVVEQLKDVVAAYGEMGWLEIPEEDMDDVIDTLRILHSFGLNYLMTKDGSDRMTQVDAYEILIKLLTVHKAYATPEGMAVFGPLQQIYRERLKQAHSEDMLEAKAG